MTKLIVKKLYTIEIESEICCELCCEIIHNHIEECPICHTKFAATDQYCDLNDYEETHIQCDKCETTFMKVFGNWYGNMDDDEFDSKEWYYYPKVIVVDPPVKEVMESKTTYTLDPKMIDALWNFKRFEPLK